MKFSLLPVTALLLLISSCTKNYVIPAANSTVAAGNGTSSYFPMHVGDVWNYYPAYSTNVTAKTPANVYTINESDVATNVWIDSATGNYMAVYLNNPSRYGGAFALFTGAKPVLFIPTNPTFNQTWIDTVANGVIMTANVVSTDAQVVTILYGYTSCLEISYNYNYNVGGIVGSVNVLRYFAKGIGCVYMTVNAGESAGHTYNIQNFIVN